MFWKVLKLFDWHLLWYVYYHVVLKTYPKLKSCTSFFAIYYVLQPDEIVDWVLEFLMVDCELYHLRSCRIFCHQNCSKERFIWLNEKCKTALCDCNGKNLNNHLEAAATILLFVALSCMATIIYGIFADCQKFNRMIYSARKIHRSMNKCDAFAQNMIKCLYLTWYKVAFIVILQTYHSYPF